MKRLAVRTPRHDLAAHRVAGLVALAERDDDRRRVGVAGVGDRTDIMIVATLPFPFVPATCT